MDNFEKIKQAEITNALIAEIEKLRKDLTGFYKRDNQEHKLIAKIERLEGEVETLREALDNIVGICMNYDGYITTEGLKGLIDDIQDYAQRASVHPTKRVTQTLGGWQMSERRGARGYEKKIPRHGDYGGPLCGIIAIYEDGTEISFHYSMEGLPLEDLPPDQPADAADEDEDFENPYLLHGKELARTEKAVKEGNRR